MNRGTIVYILMFIAAGVGLWAILGIGSRLRAPTDLSGRWITEANADVPAWVGDAMDVEQSGRYFRIRFAGGRAFDMKLAEERLEDGQVELRLAGDGQQLVASGVPGKKRLRVSLSGAENVVLDLHREGSRGSGASRSSALGVVEPTAQAAAISPEP